jgi:hypothetical protein
MHVVEHVMAFRRRVLDDSKTVRKHVANQLRPDQIALHKCRLSFRPRCRFQIGVGRPPGAWCEFHRSIKSNLEIQDCVVYIVVSLTRGSWALFPPAIETLGADSRAVTCCPEDGTLTFGGWVVVVKELKPTAISIY